MEARQPDPTTCGSACLVMARQLNRPDRTPAPLTGDAFASECVSMHRTTSAMSNGGWQLPWPQSLGTAPWALAREMTLACGVPGTKYRTSTVWPWSRAGAARAVEAAVGNGHATPVYIGNSLSPRHVVLVTGLDGATWQVYEPASGRVLPVVHQAFTSAKLGLAGWDVPWCLVVPATG